MVPTRLSLSQFLCYRDPVEIDFRGIRLACLSGENGAGKSSLLDAITWALWGKARGKHDPDLVTLGGNEVAVEFCFLLNGQEYRVVRRRTLAAPGRSGRLSLEFHLRDGATWRALTGNSTNHTQALIERTLGIDYETFINSAFILQNRADEFTTKTPAERKRVLSEILNLGQYDHYEQLAREELRQRQHQLAEIDRELDAIQACLATVPQLEAEVETHRAQVERLSAQLGELRTQWDNVVQLLQLLEAAERMASQHAQHAEEVRTRIRERERQRETVRASLQTHEAVLARAAEITARFERWRQLRQQKDELTQRLQARQPLLATAQRLEDEIRREVHRVERELHACEQQLATLARELARIPQLEQEQARLHRELEALGDPEDAAHQIRARLEEVQGRRGELQAECRRLREQMRELKDKLDQLDQIDAACPVCLRPLDARERERLKAEVEAEGRALGDAFRERRAEIELLDAERARHEAELKRLQDVRVHHDRLGRELAVVSAQLAAAAGKRAEHDELAARRQQLAEALARGLPGEALRAELERVREQLAAIPYDEREADTLDRALADVAGVEQDYQALRQAELAAEYERRQLESLERDLEADRARLTDLCAEVERLRSQIEQATVVREQRERLRGEIQALERALHSAREALGRAQQRLDDTVRLRATAEKLAEERWRVEFGIEVYRELVTAFGKNGIQAMVIENVIPELEQRANEILDRMPGNTMRVEFRTQRQLVSKDGQAETLDILISDEAGRRPYELYSGGEMFRINFAIRVALSMLLAHRAGTRLELLVIDEGFGTQDAKGREGLVQAIRTVEDDFAMILVITHIDELKDQFPTRIDVVKTPRGSQVFVN